MNDARLYLILDRDVKSYEELFEIAQKAVSAGVDMIQLRDKRGSAKEIMDFSERILEMTKDRIPYIVNDRIDLAIACQSDGVHLGQEDIPLSTARKMLGEHVLIGISCQTLAHALKAQEEGADYIGLGSVFRTLTKPARQPLDVDIIRKVFHEIKIPVYAIGGIDLTNLDRLVGLGVDRIAVCRAILQADDIEETVKQFKKHFQLATITK